MTEKEKELAKLTAQLEQIAEDLLDPMLDDQTTVLINAMGKVREKIKRLENEKIQWITREQWEDAKKSLASR
jgi:hypothetical protein